MDELARAGVEHVCLAPGSRSTPLVMACARDDRFRTWVHLDERSAGFFALGLGKASGGPAAVITTSGTATANLFPAVIEASQSRVPLLLLTADRPPRLRGSDANQTIDQPGMYGSYVRESLEAGEPSFDDLGAVRGLACTAVASTLGCEPGSEPGPVHVDLPFDRPLDPVEPEGDAVDAHGELDPLSRLGHADGTPWKPVADRSVEPPPGEVGRVADVLRKGKRGLIVAGPVADPSAVGPALIRLAAATGFPLLADSLSGARFEPREGSLVTTRHDLILVDARARTALRPDVLLRVGRAPTSAALLSFLEECSDVPQVVVAAGLPSKDYLCERSHRVRADVAAFLDDVTVELSDTIAPTSWSETWRALDVAAGEVVARSEGDPFEGDVLAAVVAGLPPGGTLFISNSMPVRDLDAFGGERLEPLRVYGNRGASGIDGIVSTAAGIAAAASGPMPSASADREPFDGAGATVPPLVAVLGDLAFYHDMNGLLAVAQHHLDLVLVVIHNDGGGIFHMLPIREHEPEFTEYFATPHGLDFSHAAELYGIPYRRLDDPTETPAALREALERGGPRILEIPSDRDQNACRRAEVTKEVNEAVWRQIEKARTSDGV